MHGSTVFARIIEEPAQTPLSTSTTHPCSQLGFSPAGGHSSAWGDASHTDTPHSPDPRGLKWLWSVRQSARASIGWAQRGWALACSPSRISFFPSQWLPSTQNSNVLQTAFHALCYLTMTACGWACLHRCHGGWSLVGPAFERLKEVRTLRSSPRDGLYCRVTCNRFKQTVTEQAHIRGRTVGFLWVEWTHYSLSSCLV